MPPLCRDTARGRGLRRVARAVAAGRPIHEIVRGRRLELGWSQRRAAAEAGIAPATWQALEAPRARSTFRALTLARAAQALGLQLEDLLAGDDQRHATASAPRTTTAGVDGHGLDGVIRDLRSLAAESPHDVAVVGRIVAALRQAAAAQQPERGRARTR
jgi:transcriptional regulator with XRE-family HTH domain